MKKLAVLLIPTMLVVPVVASAQSFQYLFNFGDGIMQFVNEILIPLLVALLILMFMWGMFKAFIVGTAESREEGKSYMVWAVVAFVVIFSLWGIVRLVGTVFGINSNQGPLPPPSTGYQTSGGNDAFGNQATY